ncbi:MAG: 3-oxoacyl-ACP synthase [Spirochaetes bacterium]|nr:3-oxoacyl-ACP synthase [Spirochaetota bacterium]
MQTRFESLGVYLPDQTVSTQDLVARMATKPVFNLEELTGIRYRRWRDESEDSYSLALTAARKCLTSSRYSAEDLDIIICSSITRFKDGMSFYLEPALSKGLKGELGLRPDALNFDITNACAGMLTGLFILNNMIKSGQVKTGMVVSGECITPISETALKEIREPVDKQFASLTVGDSGAAYILDGTMDDAEGIDMIDFMTMSEFAELCFGMPSTENSGVAMYTDAMAIHKETIKRLPDIMVHMMKKHGISPRDIDFIIPHQTSSRAIHTAMDLCSHHFEVSPEICISLDKFGNTSSTSHFVVLHDYIKQGKIKKGSNVLFIALASGIVVGFVLARIGEIGIHEKLIQ